MRNKYIFLYFILKYYMKEIIYFEYEVETDLTIDEDSRIKNYLLKNLDIYCDSLR